MAVDRTDDNETGGTDRAGTTAEGPDAKVAGPGLTAPEAPDPKIAAAVAAAEAAGPQSGESVRIDSWIWSVRLAKTRSAGATACRGGHVQVNGERVKPAHSLRVGDEVRVRQEGRERIVIVKRLIRKRVGAPVAVQCYVDNSPPPPPRTAVAPMRHPRSRHRPPDQARPPRAGTPARPHGGQPPHPLRRPGRVRRVGRDRRLRRTRRPGRPRQFGRGTPLRPGQALEPGRSLGQNRTLRRNRTLLRRRRTSNRRPPR